MAVDFCDLNIDCYVMHFCLLRRPMLSEFEELDIILRAVK